MSRADDPGRSALIRYLGDCVRAELRARHLHDIRRQRVQEAIQQIREFDQQQVATAAEMEASIRMVKRRGNLRKRAA